MITEFFDKRMVDRSEYVRGTNAKGWQKVIGGKAVGGRYFLFAEADGELECTNDVDKRWVGTHNAMMILS